MVLGCSFPDDLFGYYPSVGVDDVLMGRLGVQM